MDRDRKRDAAAQKGMMAAIRARTAEDHAATDATRIMFTDLWRGIEDILTGHIEAPISRSFRQ